MMIPRSVATALAMMLAVHAASLQAQGVPPRPPRDSTPALRPPATPRGPRPADVAPRAPTLAPVRQMALPQADSAARTPQAPGVPVEAVRPKARAAVVPSAAEMPPVFGTPPAPKTRPATDVTTPPSIETDLPVPSGATARCKDGSYLFSAATSLSCSDRGGLAVLFPSPPSPPTPPRRP